MKKKNRVERRVQCPYCNCFNTAMLGRLNDRAVTVKCGTCKKEFTVRRVYARDRNKWYQKLRRSSRNGRWINYEVTSTSKAEGNMVDVDILWVIYDEEHDEQEEQLLLTVMLKSKFPNRLSVRPIVGDYISVFYPDGTLEEYDFKVTDIHHTYFYDDDEYDLDRPVLKVLVSYEGCVANLQRFCTCK